MISEDVTALEINIILLCFMGYNPVKSHRWLLMLRGNLVPPFSFYPEYGGISFLWKFETYSWNCKAS
jgi:hypothetical protein